MFFKTVLIYKQKVTKIPLIFAFTAEFFIVFTLLTVEQKSKISLICFKFIIFIYEVNAVVTDGIKIDCITMLLCKGYNLL